MKILVCGSRKFPEPETVISVLEQYKNYPNMELIHGNANGPDKWAGRLARKWGWKETSMPADWETHGKLAGIIRNQQMLDLNPDLVIAFWDGRSKGTQHTIVEAEARSIETDVYVARSSTG